MSRVGAALMAAALLGRPALAQPTGDSGFEGVRFGVTSAELLQQFGARATMLDRRLDFGDAYVDVTVRRYVLGGFPFIVFFQMDKASGLLKRIQIERPRHGAVAMVHRAAVTALTAQYGAPTYACVQAAPRSGRQAIDERIWQRDGVVVRLVFREQDLGVLVPRRLGVDDWQVWEPSLEGMPQQLFVRIAPAAGEPVSCGALP
ncbi:hypothetical protein [Reyranella sp. CPCC 100927]|uniref:hypothetical protein n=1 Tax=Reyranella sp. CPCC 100927 TaxID=2599616 RepID=UPI0011B50717|nr:hypothetical protein [Reyranella sp. CPCC 100927]TWT02099.1 hypothetical protein FQU96_31475 [Reyranella sp. CPCC 100927]